MCSLVLLFDWPDEKKYNPIVSQTGDLIVAKWPVTKRLYRNKCGLPPGSRWRRKNKKWAY